VATLRFMDNQITAEDEQALAELRASLLRRRCPDLQPARGRKPSTSTSCSP
jgi:hypothetical protein